MKQLARELEGDAVRALLGFSSEKTNGSVTEGEVKAENGTTVRHRDPRMSLSADGCSDSASKTSETKARESKARTRESRLLFPHRR